MNAQLGIGKLVRCRHVPDNMRLYSSRRVEERVRRQAGENLRRTTPSGEIEGQVCNLFIGPCIADSGAVLSLRNLPNSTFPRAKNSPNRRGPYRSWHTGNRASP